MGDIDINQVKDIDPIKIRELTGIEPIEIDAIRNIDPIQVDAIRNIEPVAVHIKEVNHIDPLSIDAVHVSEVKNIDPIRVERFDVTHVPPLNMVVRQLPTVDMNLRQVPPLSMGTYQNFDLPSSYTVRARFLGFEFLRVHLCGRTMIVPQERYRREQSRVANRSYAQTATAGEPAIPSECRETSATVRYTAPPHAPRCAPQIGRQPAPSSAGWGPMHAPAGAGGSLSLGSRAMRFAAPSAHPGGGTVRSGG